LGEPTPGVFGEKELLGNFYGNSGDVLGDLNVILGELWGLT
jgi:hypothetical protein